MPGKQAKILAAHQIDNLLLYAETTRYPLRDRAIVLLSVKAGLRAAEIANLTWDMVLDPNGTVGTSLELRDCAAKKRHGRIIPLHADLRQALSALQGTSDPSRPVVLSERGSKMRARSIVIWFSRAYRAVNLDGCSSHSGRRTFITRAARLVHRAGGSLRDVQLLAGHRSIQTTQGYIDGDSDAQRALICLI
ncbi:site-specific integrase [Bradyrhizobium liaoningense]|uniref:tyrosine-type recombinase/integrase n=1 Tax=Bradyrhizobium liaoningense TaxID=43992 RepID=UPI001BA9C783|nr:site-specific integrase [Bradyrhizobium liaoningense]MBR0838696.1 site-specific integrase [Bradyrhizobium liaoningense]